MNYVITFSDVMTGVISLVLAVLAWLIEKYEKRISELEDETSQEVRGLETRINEFKSDFATTFVLREDYFRAMNKMEDSIKNIDTKIDKLLMRSDK